MFKPLFSGKQIVGWIEPGRFVFDRDMAFIAFISRGNAWTQDKGFWLGPAHNDHLYDMAGRVVAWSQGLPIMDLGAPLRQMKMTPPVRPVRPVRPVLTTQPLRAPETRASWSSLSLSEWVAAGTPVEIKVEDVLQDQTDQDDQYALHLNRTSFRVS